MAAKKNNTANTAVTLVIVAVVGYLAYKLFFSKKTTGAFGGSPVGGADLGANPLASLFPQQQQAQKPSSSLGASASPSQSQSQAKPFNFNSWLSGVLNYGWNAAQNIPVTTDNLLGQVDQNGIPLEPLQTLNDLPSYSFNDPNAPWNSTDAWNSNFGPSENSLNLGSIDSNYVPQFDFGTYGQSPSYFSSDYGYGGGGSMDYGGGGGLDYTSLYEPDLQNLSS